MANKPQSAHEKKADDKLDNNAVQELRAKLLAKGLSPAQVALTLAIGRTRGEAAQRLAEVLRGLPKAR